MDYNVHDLGDSVRVRARFEDNWGGGPIDPDVVKLSIRTPAGVVTTFTYDDGDEVVKYGTGQYYSDINANAAGLWHYRWFSTGNGQAAIEKRFYVNEARAL